LSLSGGIYSNFSEIRSDFYGDHQSINLAGLLQAELNPLERLKIIGGLRVEFNSLDNTNDRIVPVFRTGVNYKLTESTFLRASFGQGYRYPSIAEKFANTTLGSIRIFPNPQVNPEKGRNSELGIKQGIKAGKITGQADVSVFFTRNQKMIEYIFGPYNDIITGDVYFGFKATNVEQSRIYGFETEYYLKRDFRVVSAILSGGYLYVYPVEFNEYTGKNTGIFLKYRRKHSAKLSGTIEFKRLVISADLYGRSRILNIDKVFLAELTREQILPGFYDYWNQHNTGYFLMDGQIGYRLTRFLRISLSMKNVTNTIYMGRPGDIRPSRNYSLRISGTF
jgi:iron complex outermembrane receptor protein